MKKYAGFFIILCLSITVFCSIKIDYIDVEDFPTVKVGIETWGYHPVNDFKLLENGKSYNPRINVSEEIPPGEVKILLLIDNSNSMNSKLNGIVNFFEEAKKIIALSSSWQTSFQVVGFSEKINCNSDRVSVLEISDLIADVIRNTGYGKPQIASVLKELIDKEERPSLVFIAGDDEMNLTVSENLSLADLLKEKGIPVYLIGEDYNESVLELSEKSGGKTLGVASSKSIAGAIERVERIRYEFEYTSDDQYSGIHLVALNDVESVYNAPVITPPIIWIDTLPSLVRADTKLKFSGKLRRGPAEMELFHNGNSIPFELKENGDFSAELYMKEGENKTMIFAASKWGKSSTVSRITGLKPLEKSLKAEINWTDETADLDLYVYTPLGTAYLMNSKGILKMVDVESGTGLERFYFSEEKFTCGNYIFKVHYYDGFNPVSFDFKLFMDNSLVYESNMEIGESNSANSGTEDTGEDWVTVAEMLIE